MEANLPGAPATSVGGPDAYSACACSRTCAACSRTLRRLFSIAAVAPVAMSQSARSVAQVCLLGSSATAVPGAAARVLREGVVGSGAEGVGV
jgi:hypothetical protein